MIAPLCSRLCLCFTLLPCSTLVGSAPAHADDIRTFTPVVGLRQHRERAVPEGQHIIVQIRAVQGLDPLDDGAAVPREIDPELSDIAEKLERLPYRSFKPLALHERDMSMMRKEVFPLPLGQTLVLRPMPMDADHIGMWLKWRDREGSSILDSKMVLSPDDLLVTGTNCSHNEGLILSIRVSGQNMPVR